jgi:chemotaxis signal transduction protein
VNPSALGERAPRPREQVVIFSIVNQTFAISAASVQEIRSADNLGGQVREIERPVLTKVRHIVERDGHAYYVVSGQEHFGLRKSRPASVLILRSLRAAVLVDRIEEMVEMRLLFELPHSFTGLERKWYRGLTVLSGRVLPVVDPRGFLSSEDLDVLERSTGKIAQGTENAEEVQ